MTTYEERDAVIKELGQHLGIDNFALDDSVRVSFSIDGVNVTLSYSNNPIELLWILVDLGKVESVGEQFFQTLLEANYASWTSNLFTIGINDSGDRVVGHFSIPIDCLSSEQLISQVDRMVAAATQIENFEQTDYGDVREVAR